METFIPKHEHLIVNRAEKTLFPYQGWPTVCIDENGVLYAVASSFRISHICPFGKTAMYKSVDRGKTWTPPMVINDTYLDDRDAGIVSLGGGKLLVTWFTHPTDVYRSIYREHITHTNPLMKDAARAVLDETYPLLSEEDQKGGSYVRLSEDYGVTWGEPVKVPISSPHGPALLSDGSLLWLGKGWYADGLDSTAFTPIQAYRSCDCGKTWNYVSELSCPDGLAWDHFHEPHVLDLGGGHLLGSVRAQGENVPYAFSIYTVTSDDNGLSWSPMTHVDVQGSPPHLMMHSSGKVILTFARRGKDHCGERALVSSDHGKTWEKLYILDENRPEDGDLGYPSTVEMPDGSLMTVYYQKYGDDPYPSILGTHWEL